MNLFNLLQQEFGLKTNDIKTRIKNKSIKLNNSCEEGIWKEELNIDLSSKEFLGDFIFDNLSSIPYPFPFDIKDFFGPGATNISKLQHLENYTLVQLSKKDIYVFKNS